ncbi:MAG: hypothetical protein ACM3YM_04195 [Sphingomonadales bacterium]
MDQLRKPFFAVAIFWLVLAFVIELAASGWLARLTAGHLQEPATPGIAINYLAIIDGLLIYNCCWMVLQIIVPRGISGRAQGPITLILSLLALLATIGLVIAAFVLLMLMVSLLLAVPFGTIAYFAAWGTFAVTAAAATLSLAMVLKLLFCLFLVLAEQRFLQNKGLLVLIALSLGLTFVVGFIQAFLPSFLVSIGDALAALVIGIVGAIWLLLLVITSLVATVKALLSLRRV